MNNLNEDYLKLFGKFTAEYLGGLGEEALAMNKVDGILLDHQIDLSKRKLGELPDWDVKNHFNMGVIWRFAFIAFEAMGKEPAENTELFIEFFSEGLFYAERFDFEFQPPYQPAELAKAIISTAHFNDPNDSELPFNKGFQFAVDFISFSASKK